MKFGRFYKHIRLMKVMAVFYDNNEMLPFKYKKNKMRFIKSKRSTSCYDHRRGLKHRHRYYEMDYYASAALKVTRILIQRVQ